MGRRILGVLLVAAAAFAFFWFVPVVDSLMIVRNALIELFGLGLSLVTHLKVPTTFSMSTTTGTKR